MNFEDPSIKKNISLTLIETGLVPTTIFLNSTISRFSVFWNNPTTHYEIVSGYEVTWRVAGSSKSSSGLLSRTVNQYTVASGLISGQIYVVNVLSHVTLTGPVYSIVVSSADTTVRTGMEYDTTANTKYLKTVCTIP